MDENEIKEKQEKLDKAANDMKNIGCGIISFILYDYFIFTHFYFPPFFFKNPNFNIESTPPCIASSIILFS